MDYYQSINTNTGRPCMRLLPDRCVRCGKDAEGSPTRLCDECFLSNEGCLSAPENKQPADDCQHKWWALNRVIPGAVPVRDGDTVRVEAECYGRKCSVCDAEEIFGTPGPVAEPNASQQVQIDQWREGLGRDDMVDPEVKEVYKDATGYGETKEEICEECLHVEDRKDFLYCRKHGHTVPRGTNCGEWEATGGG